MSPSMESTDRFPVEEAFRVITNIRAERDVVITNQGSARLWPRISHHAGDFNYNPSTMGGAIPLGLGIALACPARHVFVISGDGSLLMNLGCLVTVIDSRVANLTVILLDNGLYEVTGGQATPAQHSETDFAGIARAVGFPVAQSYCHLEHWQSQAATIVSAPGPRFVSLQVSPLLTDCLNDPTPPIQEQLHALELFLKEP